MIIGGQEVQPNIVSDSTYPHHEGLHAKSKGETKSVFEKASWKGYVQIENAFAH